MGFSADQGPAVLQYVARTVDGSIQTIKTRFDSKKGENVQEVALVDNPIIVFFPNGTSQVLSGEDAERLGFLKQPTVLNLEAVEKPDTVAGRFKFAFTDVDRKRYWVEMEQAIISRCIQRGGHPLPNNVTVSNKTLYFQE